MLFVFAALLEFAYVNVTYRVTNRRKSIQDLPMFIHQNRDARFDSIFSKETEEKLNVGLSLKSMIADFFFNGNILLYINAVKMFTLF